MRFEFRVIDGPNADWRFQLRPHMEYTVGRTDSADMALPNDMMLSSVHFKLETSDQECRVSDLGSTNGTFVNESRVHAKVLVSGDTIRAGGTEFEFIVVRLQDTQSVKNTMTAAQPPDPAATHAVGAADVARLLPSSVPPSSSVRPEIAAASDSSSKIEGGVGRVEISHPTGVETLEILEGATVVVGRTEHADKVVPDRQISALHCSLTIEGGVLLVRDLGSSNGTLVNNAPVAAVTLSVGDSFVAGTSQFVFLGVGNVSQSRPPHLATTIENTTDPQIPRLPRSTQSVPSNTGWPFQQGLIDEDGPVRVAAFIAAICQMQTWVVDRSRAAALALTKEDFHEALFLAALADDQDLPLIQKLLLASHLGPRRFRLASICGNPRLIPLLMTLLESSDPTTAYFAGAAFSRMTGIEIDSERSAEVEDPHSDVPLEIRLPDPALAKSAWQERAAEFGSAKRIANGRIVESILDSAQLEPDDTMDMESLWIQRLRRVFGGREKPTFDFLFNCHQFFAQV